MDSILESIGPFGLYQKILLFLIGSLSALVSMNMYAGMFTAGEPSLECKLKELVFNSNKLKKILATNEIKQHVEIELVKILCKCNLFTVF